MNPTGCLPAEGTQLHVMRQKLSDLAERFFFTAVLNICLALADQSKLYCVRGGLLVVFLHDARGSRKRRKVRKVSEARGF